MVIGKVKLIHFRIFWPFTFLSGTVHLYTNDRPLWYRTFSRSSKDHSFSFITVHFKGRPLWTWLNLTFSFKLRLLFPSSINSFPTSNDSFQLGIDLSFKPDRFLTSEESLLAFEELRLVSFFEFLFIPSRAAFNHLNFGNIYIYRISIEKLTYFLA